MLERVREGEGVMESLETHVVTPVIIHMVINIFTDTVPANSFSFLYLIGESQYLHTIIVEGVRLHQINHIEFYFHALESVADTEEVPLSVPIGVYVILQYQIVLIVGNFDSRKEIAGF